MCIAKLKPQRGDMFIENQPPESPHLGSAWIDKSKLVPWFVVEQLIARHLERESKIAFILPTQHPPMIW